jgi:hypothetical protein
MPDSLEYYLLDMTGCSSTRQGAPRGERSRGEAGPRVERAEPDVDARHERNLRMNATPTSEA